MQFCGRYKDNSPVVLHTTQYLCARTPEQIVEDLKDEHGKDWTVWAGTAKDEPIVIREVSTTEREQLRSAWEACHHGPVHPCKDSVCLL